MWHRCSGVLFSHVPCIVSAVTFILDDALDSTRAVILSRFKVPWWLLQARVGWVRAGLVSAWPEVRVQLDGVFSGLHFAWSRMVQV